MFLFTNYLSIININYLYVSLNGITRSRFIGYNLSLLKHPFISAAKLQKYYQRSSTDAHQFIIFSK